MNIEKMCYKDRFTYLYYKYYNDIKYLAISIVHDIDTAEDLAQNTFMKLWTQLHKYKNNLSSIKTFIIMLFLNELSAFKKKKTKNDTLVFNSEILDEINEIDDNIHKYVDIKANDFAIQNDNWSAIASVLTSNEFLIFYYRCNDVSYNDISKIIGVTQVNARVTYGRAKKKIRDIYAEVYNGRKDKNNK